MSRNELRRPFAALVALLAVACASSLTIGPPPVQTPAGLATAVGVHFGTCLTGALATTAVSAPDPATTPIVHAELFLVASLENVGPRAPIAEEIRFVVQPGSTTPLRGPSRLTTRGSRLVGLDLPQRLDLWRRGDDGNALLVAEESRPLPAATTCTIAVVRGEHVDDPDDFLGEHSAVGDVSKRFGVAVEAPPPDAKPAAKTDAKTDAKADAKADEKADEKEAAEGIAVTLDLADLVRPTSREWAERSGATAAAAADSSRPLEPRRELVRLNATLKPDGGPLIFVLPSPFHDDARGGRVAPWCAVAVELLPPPTDADAKAAHAEAVATAWKQAQEEAREAQARTAVRPPDDVVAIALRRAFAGLKPEPASRAAVVYVTTATAASFAGDFALVASDDELIAWLRELSGHVHDPAPDVTTAAIGWAVERSAWHHVIAAMMSGDPPPEVEATVLRHAGAVGRLATSLEEAVDESGDLATLERRFVAENRAALEDSAAASRVRAFDWLATRGLAPAGFDPLASSEQRRRALEGGEPRRD